MEQVKANSIPELLRSIEYDANNLMKKWAKLEGIVIYSQWDELWSEDVKKVMPAEELHDFILTPQNYLPKEGELCYFYMRVFPLSKRGEVKHSELRRKENSFNERVIIPNFSYEFFSPRLPAEMQKKILQLANEQLHGLSDRIGRSLPLGVEL